MGARTIAVYSLTGGVGKTTLAVNPAWPASALSSRRTLPWDLDRMAAAAGHGQPDAAGPRAAAGTRTGGAGRTLTWSADSSDLFTVETYRDEARRSGVIRVRQHTAEKVVDSTAGELITIA